MFCIRCQFVNNRSVQISHGLIELFFHLSFEASCVNCFEKMERVVENCKLFSKKVNCDLKVQECEEAKASLSKYCSSKECPGE